MPSIWKKRNAILFAIFTMTIFSSSSSSFATAAAENEIFYVIEPFDSVSDQWFTRVYNDQGKINLTISTSSEDNEVELQALNDPAVQGPLFGNGALRVEYEVVQTEDWGGFVDFGWILNSTGVAHNCYGATHLSLWYKILEKQSLPGRVHLRLIMMDDSDCTLDGYDCADPPGQNLENYYSFHYVLDDNHGTDNIFDATNSATNDSEWQELRLKLLGDESSESPFWRTGWTGQVGNNNLDAERLRGWRIELSIDSQSEIGSLSEGALLIDQLACVGGGDLLGAAFRPKEIELVSSDQNSFLEQSLMEGAWFERYYQSDQSKNLSQALLTSDGTLFMNYTIEQAESWGGFLDYQHIAPGNAYYNLSQSTDISLNYNISLAASSVGRSHLRIILMDGSDCTRNCSLYPGQNLENYYSFNYILDDDSLDPWSGNIIVALEGDSKSSSPFWRTGWTGVVGDNVLDSSYIKGFRFELNVDSQGDVGSLVSGTIALKDLSAVSKYDPSLSNSDKNETDAPLCVKEIGLQLNTEDSFSSFRKVEFLGSKCCETCQADVDCIYALSSREHCWMTSYLHPKSISLMNTVYKQSTLTAFWMDDFNKRGDFCTLCTCQESNSTIDCRGKDLAILPKVFLPLWMPRILDLRNNPRLSIIGSGALSGISDQLQELRLPTNMRHISHQSIMDLEELQIVTFEGIDSEDKSDEEMMNSYVLNNVISSSSGIFGDICCGLGFHLSLMSPSDGLTFCELEVDTPGIDSFKESFWEYAGADQLVSIKPSSSFMAEAAESPEKCAEYCAISEGCNYFSYDARWKESEHSCNLLRNNGTQSYECCNVDDYADEEQKSSGWTSGRPPRTRYDIDDARILINTQNLDFDSSNDYKAQFSISLGSMPLRGAVWVEPKVETKTDLNIIISPTRVVLYDNRTVTTFTVEVLNVNDLSPGENKTVFLQNIIESCDTAFTMGNSLSETIVIMNVISDIVNTSVTVRSRFTLVIILVPLAVSVLLVSAYVYVHHKKRKADSIWSVKMSELSFDEPPEIIGRGSFGLVLLAEYRGTQVAVKRVIPPRNDKGKGSRSSGDTVILDRSMFSHNEIGSQEFVYKTKGSGVGSMNRLDEYLKKYLNDGKNSSTKMSSYLPINRHSRLKADFINEMRHLSKLRHPCITTVMGAIISRKEEPMLIMEYMYHGSLYDLLHNETIFLEGEQILPILQDIAHGLRFLHAAKPQVIHGDLKAQNILVDSRFRAKVADFGLSQKKHIGGTGTPYWMAPELLRKESQNKPATDVYSFGIILYEVYSRREPYEGENFMEVLQNVADPSVNMRPPIPLDCPEEIQSFMSQCLSGDPDTRPTFEDIDLRLRYLDITNVEPGKLHLSMQQAKKEKELTDTLLFEVFPQHIAIALRDGTKVEPEIRQVVTIFFSDIVGFTKISSSLSAIKISHMLDRLYSKFDELSTHHDIFKVETIGDAYMAATNLVKDQTDHTTRIAQFSIDTLKAANTTLIDIDNPSMGFVNIRVGFHSGPVVASVVGSRNPRYCLFGDTVNTASRMESNSEENRVHCSERAAMLLKNQNPEMSVCSRGKIEVKGKGEMETYWVNEVPIELPDPTTNVSKSTPIYPWTKDSKVECRDTLSQKEKISQSEIVQELA